MLEFYDGIDLCCCVNIHAVGAGFVLVRLLNRFSVPIFVFLVEYLLEKEPFKLYWPGPAGCIIAYYLHSSA